MQLPRPRSTVRRLMVAVAIVGVFVGLAVEGERRRARFQALAEYHRNIIMGRYFILLGGAEDEVHRRIFRQWEEVAGPTIDHHGNLVQKYEWAARFPWLPVSSDPPAPPIPSDLELLRAVQ
jgi:hypothetical protein